MSIRTEATIDDLYRVPENGKAELVNGELVLMSPTGEYPAALPPEFIEVWMTMSERPEVVMPSRTTLVFPMNTVYLRY